MKYLSQFLLIMGFTLMGEVLQRIIPLPIPASVYGLVLLLAALCAKWVQVEQVKEVGGFLSSILPLLFVSPLVGIVDIWGIIRNDILVLFLLSLGSTFLAFAVGGRLTQYLIRKEGRNHG